ncbi:MAG: caspase family protein, partial [Schlesneria sp.]
MRQFVLLIALVFISNMASAQDEMPHKYALFVGVSEYEYPEMNTQLLQFPETDAKSMRDLFKEAGYEVDVLLGKKATQATIRNRLASFAEKGGNKGVLVVGLFGHGIEFD